MNSTDFRQALVTMQMEYVEMPELKLTLWQASRLWTLPIDMCEAALAALVATGFLVHTPDGLYRRRGTAPVHIDALDTMTWALRGTSPSAA